jgi:HlyD family secretion protein
MKIRMIAGVILISLVLIGVTACKSGGNAVSKSQTVTVQPGNLTVAVTATGNLSLSHVQNLAFQAAGTVTDVLVSVGDSVTKGEVLANLDSTAWNNQITSLQDTLTAKQRALTSAQHQLESKQHALAAAQNQLAAKQNALQTSKDQVAAKQDAILQAQSNLQNAQYNLNVINDVAAANAQLTSAQQALANDETQYEAALQAGSADTNFYSQVIAADKATIAQAQKNLQDVLSGHSTTLSADENTQITLKQMAVQIAQNALNEAQTAITEATTSVTDAQNGISDAQNSVLDASNAVDDAQAAVTDANTAVSEAQSNLAQTQAESLTITAPFDGFVSQVNVAQGDQIYNGKVAVQLSDPTQFEVDVLVSERDISNLSLNQPATVQLDAFSGQSLPGVVSKISHTATIQSGVVNYQVGVQITSLTPVSAGGRTSSGGGGTSGGTSSRGTTSGAGGTPSASRSPSPSGTPSTAGNNSGTGGANTGAAGAAAAGTAPSTAVQAKAGMTATANIVIAQANNVLLVPTLAVISQSNGEFVQVLKNGVVSQVQVQVGLSNFQEAEIRNGLSSGDVVVIPQTSSSTSGGNRGPSFFPGGGLRIGG